MKYLLYLCLAFAASAGDLELWNTTEFKVVEKGRISLNAAGTARVRDGLSDAYDNRLGASLKASLTNRIAVSGGYLHRWIKGEQQDRLLAVYDMALVSRPVGLRSTTTYERHLVPGDDFNRYKQKIEAEWTRERLSPVLWQEFTLRDYGLMRSRTWAGVRLRPASGVAIDVGYQFESSKSGTAWKPRHAIRTTLSLTKLPALIH